MIAASTRLIALAGLATAAAAVLAPVIGPVVGPVVPLLTPFAAPVLGALGDVVAIAAPVDADAAEAEPGAGVETVAVPPPDPDAVGDDAGNGRRPPEAPLDAAPLAAPSPDHAAGFSPAWAPLPASLQPAQAPAPRFADPIAALSPEARAAAFAPEAPAATALLQAVRVEPERVCAALADAGFTMSPWQTNLFGTGEWRCVSDILAVAAAGPDGAAPSSLFVAVHGRRAGEVGLVRFKLNIEDRASAGAAKERLKAAVAALHAALGWAEPAGLSRAIDNLDRFERRSAGVRIAFTRERGDVPRFNLVIDPPDRGEGLFAGAFRRLP